MRQLIVLCWLGAILTLSSCTNTRHPFNVAGLFQDHMVLQRNQPITIWGSAEPGSAVDVSLLSLQGQAIADETGAWQVTLPAHPEAGPFDILINGDSKRVIRNAYLGEVWLASGQSNMEWKLRDGVEGNTAEIAQANFPMIRFFDVPNTVAASEMADLPETQWQVISPQNAGDISAVAWHFAKRLHRDQNVAVGIIEANWGGTPVEAWMPAEAVKAMLPNDGRFTQIANEPNWPQRIQSNIATQQEKWHRVTSLDEAKRSGAHRLNFDDSQWQTIDLPNRRPLQHFVWLRKHITLSERPQSQVALQLGDLIQNAVIFVNGQVVAQEDWRSGAMRYDVPTSWWNTGDNIIAIRVNNDWDNQVFVGHNGVMQLSVDGHTIALNQGWRYSNQAEPPMPEVKRFQHLPGFLYNAMIHPLTRYGLGGVIWYQGENNVAEHQHYQALFGSLIEQWRSAMQRPELPFVFTQLAAFMPHKPVQPASQWAYLRDAQRDTLKLHNTAMAVTIDIGDADDIHPRNKADVGHRMWLAASCMVYGDQQSLCQGPDAIEVSIEDDEVTVTFDHAKGLTTTDGQPPSGFMIAGEDRKFYPATANIQGNQVQVSSPQVTTPVAIRYAWADNPKVNLVNQDNLPAVPFRSDDWPAESVKN